VQTIGLPYTFCIYGLWLIIEWFWDLRKILFNLDQTFQENISDIRNLRSGIWTLITQVEPIPEKVLSQDEIESEEYLGQSLEPRLKHFKYEELDYPTGVWAIRIVELLPGKTLEDIKCRLRPVILKSPSELASTTAIDVQGRELSGANQEQGQHSPTSYEALSYCWGDNTAFKTPIICNGARLEITRNLKSALQHLRDEENVRILWVDAICLYLDRYRTKYCGNLRLGPRVLFPVLYPTYDLLSLL
jgi:hypothetical protein